MLSRKLIGCALLFVVEITFAQTFSGELHYTITYKAKKASFSIDSLKEAGPGTDMTYLIADGYYKTSFLKDGKPALSYMYHGDSQKMFDERADQPIITYRDSRRGRADLIRSRIYKDSIRTIAGHKCFMVERVHANRIDYCFYATDLKINPELFKDHGVGDWYASIKEVNGALGMGSISEYATHIEYHQVTKLIPRVVKSSEFALPKDKPVFASQEALDIQVALQPPSQQTYDCYTQKTQTFTARAVGNMFISYIGFVVHADGTTSHFMPYAKDPNGFDVVATDILQNCGFTFSPGMIGGKAVDSFIYFPVEAAK